MKSWNRNAALGLILSCALIAVGIVGCSPQPTATASPEPAATTAPAAPPLVIAILANGPITDLGWSQSLDAGRKALEAAYGDRVDVRLAESVVWGEDTTKAMEQFIADGANVIIDGVTAGDYTTKVAQAHPEVKFLRTEPSSLPNEESFWYNGPQISYLVGMAAGQLTDSNQIGYVNAFDIPLLRLEIDALTLGARSVNPDATVSVTTINSWYDPGATKQASEALMASGADVLWGIVNDPANTIAVAEEREAWAVGTMGDTRSFAPNMFVTSSLINFGPMFVDMIGRILDGQWEGNGAMRFYGIPEGMSLADWGPNVPQEVRDQVDATRDQIINNGYDPLAGPIVDKDGAVVLAEGQSLTGLEVLQGVPWLVAGVEGLE